MRILIAAGGTGGHIYPALAVLAQLAIERSDLDVRWVGGRRGLEGEIVTEAGFPLERLWLRSLRTVDVSISTLLDPLRLLASIPQAMAMLMSRRPDVIFSTGGYVAIPVLLAATMLRIPSLLWEGNRLPGRSVRAVAARARARAVSFPATAARLPAPTFVTGTPIRDLRGLDRSTSRAQLGLPDDVPVLLIFGGSQAVRRFNEAVDAALDDLVERCAVIHVTGPIGFAAAEARRDTLPAASRERYRPFAFLHDEMAAAIMAADLLVGRAGSSTLAEASAAGLPMVVVPYPHAAAHQRANASELVEAGGAVLVEDAELDAAALLRACDLLFDERLARMSAAARSVGRPGAAAATSSMLSALASGAALPSPEQVDAVSRGATAVSSGAEARSGSAEGFSGSAEPVSGDTDPSGDGPSS